MAALLLNKYVEDHGLTRTNGNFTFVNDAGFVFEIEHVVLDGAFYRQEQQEIVSGFDGSNRWNNLINVLYGGAPPLMQYCFLKFMLDRSPAFKSVYDGSMLVKVVVDCVMVYGIMFAMMVFNDQVELLTTGVLLGAFVVYLLQTKEKPVFVNFLTTPNPNPIVSLTIDE